MLRAISTLDIGVGLEGTRHDLESNLNSAQSSIACVMRIAMLGIRCTSLSTARTAFDSSFQSGWIQ
jgi:hypothetical protein